MSEEEVIDTPQKAKKSKRTTIPTAKAEWVDAFLDISKKKLSIPDYVEYEGKRYKVRRETLKGLLSLSHRYYPQHSAQLQKLIEDYKVQLGKPRPKHGEIREYQISNLGTLQLPVRFLMNEKLEGVGRAKVEWLTDQCIVSIIPFTPSK